MKTYIFPSIIYISSFIAIAALRILLRPYIPEPLISIIFWGLILLLFAVYIQVFTAGWRALIKCPRPDTAIIGVMLAVPVLFVVNNLFIVWYAYDAGYVTALKSAFSLTVVKFTVTSASEEIVYRGFLQNYTDQKLRSSRTITAGNVFATTIMVLTHLGFFTIMPPLFAITSLLVVIAFSLSAGYLLSKTHNIILSVLLHIACNYIHILIQCTHTS